MLISRTAIEVESNSWVWSKWLQKQQRATLNYHGFTHYEFIEDETKRPEIRSELATLLYEYHTASPVDTSLLAQLRYRHVASVLSRNRDQRPRDTNTQTGNLIEILACEFARTLGYVLPILRLQYNPNPNQSMKGDDILGFRFREKEEGRDAFLVGEGKFRSRFESSVVKDAYEDLNNKARSYPTSTEFIATILTLREERSLAAQIRQLRQKIAAQDRNVLRENLLFLGTIGQPQDPFEHLETYGNTLLPNTIAVNVVFKSGLKDWISQVYQEECWN